jgi:hypothetical protein
MKARYAVHRCYDISKEFLGRMGKSEVTAISQD